MVPLRAVASVSTFFVTCLLLFISDARGHAQGENYVWINVEPSHLEGRFEINLTDLKSKLGIDAAAADEDAEAIVRSRAPEVQQYIRRHFRFLVDGQELPFEFTETTVFGEAGKAFAQYHYETAELEVPDSITIHNSLLFENDLLHRSLIAMQRNVKTGEEYVGDWAAMVFGPGRTDQELNLLDVRPLLRARQFVWQGVLHIWIGIDHILFLIALLLPAVLVRKDGKWTAVPGFRTAFWNIVKIVTLFTIAHSITLALAALNIVQLPSRIVESAIALSIVLVGVNTIFPTFSKSSWLIIFGFGLFHGLGFASVLGELPFRIVNAHLVLIAFNVGVELGQVAIVAAAFPIIFLLRESQAYLPVVLRGGSFAIVLVASYWFVERAFGL